MSNAKTAAQYPGEINELLEAIGWNKRYFADLIQSDERTVRRWNTMENIDTPPAVLEYLRVLGNLHQIVPLPSWRAPRGSQES